MKRTTRNTLFAICCSAAMLGGIGCTSDGEMSIDGFYQARSGSLAGDECDDLLVAAAESEGEKQEELKGMYRECVEEAIAEQGGQAEANENDATCDIILDEIGDAIDRIRAQRDHNEAPNCQAPSSNGDEALCHLMDAYEVCQLDHDGDGDADVDVLPPEACEREANAAETEEERARFEDAHPECSGDRDRDQGENGGEGDRDEDAAGEDGREGDRDGESAENGGIGDKTCDTIRELHAGVGEADREFLERERPECFGQDGGESADGSNHGESGQDGESAEGGEGDVDAFCAELTEQIQNAETEAKKADLEEIFDRECTP